MCRSCAEGGRRCVDHRRLRGLGAEQIAPPAGADTPEVAWAHEPTASATAVYEQHDPAVAGEAVAQLCALREVEPAMSADVLAAIPAGAEASGLANRVKSPDSLARKIENRSERDGIAAHAAAEELTDLVRYTATCPSSDQLVGDASATVAGLEQRGWRLVEAEHSYVAGNPYQGLHLLAQHPSGWTAELQLHSSESLAVKDANHGDYEIERDEYQHSVAERAAAYRRMVARSATLTEPAGLAELGELAGVPVQAKRFPDRYTTAPSRNADQVNSGKEE